MAYSGPLTNSTYGAQQFEYYHLSAASPAAQYEVHDPVATLYHTEVAYDILHWQEMLQGHSTQTIETAAQSLDYANGRFPASEAQTEYFEDAIASRGTAASSSRTRIGDAGYITNGMGSMASIQRVPNLTSMVGTNLSSRWYHPYQDPLLEATATKPERPERKIFHYRASMVMKAASTHLLWIGNLLGRHS